MSKPPEEQKHCAILRDWEVGLWFGGKSHVITARIHGDVKGRYKDGHQIRTSALKLIDFENGIAVTQNSKYKLEKK